MRRSALLGGAVAIALSTPAAARPTVLTANPALAAAVFSSTFCSPAGLAVAGTPAPPRSAVPMTKSAAILGGEVSALERMRMQQAGALTPVAAAAATPEPEFEALAPGRLAMARTIAPCAGTGLGTGPDGIGRFPDPQSDDSFLESRRVEIGVTSFDKDWRRVQRESLGSTYRKAFGRREVAPMEAIRQVNQWVNRQVSYVEDRDLFGKADFWAGARTTLKLGKGDCEDFALTKMQLLASAGIARKDMFLTIARDRSRNADHAVLVVKIDGRFVVLDNATDELLDGRYSHDFAPLLSFNDSRTWLHGY